MGESASRHAFVWSRDPVQERRNETFYEVILVAFCFQLISAEGEREREREMAHGKFQQHIKIKFRNLEVPHVIAPKPPSHKFVIGDLCGNFTSYSEMFGFVPFPHTLRNFNRPGFSLQTRMLCSLAQLKFFLVNPREYTSVSR